MSDTTRGDNVTPITRPGSGHPDHPGHRDGDEWPSAADAVGRQVDPENDEGTAAVLDGGIPATQFFESMGPGENGPDGLRRSTTELLSEVREREGRPPRQVGDEVWEEEEPEDEPEADGPVEVQKLDAPVRTPKTRTLTRAEREAQEQEAERIRIAAERERIAEKKELDAERKRFDEIDPLRAGVFITALAIGVVIFLTSGLFSYAAIAAAAEWMRPEWGWLVLLVPGFVEAFMVFFGIDGIVYQAKAVYAKTEAQQRYYRKMAISATIWMAVFAAVAVVGNGAHTLFRWLEEGDIPWYGFVGIAMAALAPLSVVLITKRVSRLVFIYAVKE